MRTGSRLVLTLTTAMLLFGSFTASASAAPANDNFAARQALSGPLPITAPASNIGATAEPGEPDIFTNDAISSVWFTWTAGANAAMVVDLCNAGFTGSSNPFLAMAVRTGSTLGTLALTGETAGTCSLRFNAVAGITYHFQIDYRNDQGNFNFKLRAQSPPANDNFVSAAVVGSALPVSTQGTTVDSTWQAGEPAALGGSSNSRSVWYSWTAPSSERIRLSLCEKTLVDGPLNSSTVVYTGTTLGTLVQVVAVTSNDCNVDFPVVAGTTYRIAVSGSIRGEFGFSLDLKSAPPPSNDSFVSPQEIGPGLPVFITANNDFATTEIGEPDHGGYSPTSRSLWFTWTAAVSGPVRLKTCSRDLFFYTSVYTGTILSALTEVGTRTYFAPCSTFFDAVAGTTYRIAVAGGPFSSTHGPFGLELRSVVKPPNDAFAAAANLGRSLTVTRKGTTVDSSTEDDEPSHLGYGGGSGGSVWYRWRAPNDRPVILEACSATEPNAIAVYRQDPESTDPPPGNLIQIDHDSSDCRNGLKGGRLAIAPVKGTIYSIAVAALEPDYESPFTLGIQATADNSTTNPGFNLNKALAKCRKIKNRKSRASCIKAARKKAALIKCRKLTSKDAEAKCVKKVRKRFK